jgi:prepilin signal peptidase PulO-like enzyme (type II secretory pathway)
MIYLISIFVFIFGLIFGSFVNALEYRTDKGISINGRSFCPNCKKQLSWLELIPVVSFFLLRGKCRGCKKTISLQYPIIELISGFSFLAIIYYKTDLFNIMSLTTNGLIRSIFQAILLAILSVLLITIALHDHKTGYIFSNYVYVAMVASVIYLLIGVEFGRIGGLLVNHIFAGIGAAGFFALLHFGSKGKWMGAGDIEVAALSGLILGWPGILISLYFAFISGSIVGLYKIYKNNKALKSEMPFGPFIIAGIYFSVIFSEIIISTYGRIFLGS